MFKSTLLLQRTRVQFPGPGFSSQQPHGSSQVTAAPRSVALFCTPWALGKYVVHIHIYRQNIHTLKKIQSCNPITSNYGMLFYVSIDKIVTVRIKDNRDDTGKPRSRTYPQKTQPAVM